MLTKNMKKQLLAFLRGNTTEKKFADGLKEHVKQYMTNWRTTFCQYLKHTGQFDCVYVGYPVAQAFLSPGFNQDSDRSEDADNQEIATSNGDLLNNSDEPQRQVIITRNDEDAGSHDQDSQDDQSSAISSSSSLKSIDDSAESPKDSPGVPRPSRQAAGATNFSRQKFKTEDDIFVFMTFARPGCHTIIIYDPETKEFFKKVQIINYRNPNPNPSQPWRAGTDGSGSQLGFW